MTVLIMSSRDSPNLTLRCRSSPVAASDDFEGLDDAVLVAAVVVGLETVPASSSGIDGSDG